MLSAVLALVATGCGGSDAGGGAAEIVPADVALYASLDTDFEGDQWQAADALVRRFPDGPRLVQQLLDDLESEEGVDFEQDVKPALGPEVAVVMLEFPQGGDDPAVVLLTQPEDEAKLQALLEKSDEPLVSEAVEGWTAVSDQQSSLDAFAEASGGESLAEADAFQNATEGLEGDALGNLYVSGDALQRAAESAPGFSSEGFDAFLPGGRFPSFALTVLAEDEGARLQGNAIFAEDLEESGLVGPAYDAELPEAVPAGVLFYLSFSDLEGQFSNLRDALAGSNPEFERQLGQFEGVIGVSLEEDIAPLFAGEGALYVRRGALIPEVTLLLSVEDEERALQTVDDLAAGIGRFVPLGAPQEIDIDGVAARELRVQDAPFALVYAAFDGKLVLTSAREAISDLRGEGDRFADEEAFAQAADRAELPDETSGFGYVNLEEIVELALGFGAAAQQNVPPDVRENVEPLRELVFFQTADGDRVRFGAFLGIE